MKVRFDDKGTLIVMPKDSVEAMALRYWAREYEEHGSKMLTVATSVPPELPVKRDSDDDD